MIILMLGHSRSLLMHVMCLITMTSLKIPWVIIDLHLAMVFCLAMNCLLHITFSSYEYLHRACCYEILMLNFASSDLKTMSKRVESEQYYVTFDMFVADARRMFSNARTYNSPETIYYKCSTRHVLRNSTFIYLFYFLLYIYNKISF